MLGFELYFRDYATFVTAALISEQMRSVDHR